MRRLKITNCRNHIQEIILKEGVYTVGRSMDSDMRLEGEDVSRIHARIWVSPAECRIVDEKSKNGIFLNGRRITSSALKDGDNVKIGKFNLRFIHPPAVYTAGERHKAKNASAALLKIFLVIAVCLLFYYRGAYIKTASLAAEATAQFLAERNKEALYLGEYTSINLSSLPKEIKKIVLWDRKGNIRAHYPAEPFTYPDIAGKITHQIVKKRRTIFEIYTPVYYESVRVGTLWILYKT